MRAALDLAGSVELAVLDRSGLDESRHLGAAVVVDDAGTVLRALGDESAPIYPRSSLKPLQAMAVLGTGVSLSPVQGALATASHAGSAAHVEVVRSILASAGLDDAALRCPTDWPLDGHARDAKIASGGTKTRIAMNCSGKHASFLAASVHEGWDTASYLDPAHPLQRAIRATVEELTGEAIEHSGIDGCGAPVHAVSLVALARAMTRIAGPTADTRGTWLAESVRSHPWAIGGETLVDTIAIERLGVFAKRGAEGVMVVVTPEGASVAVKILDGSLRPAMLVALELLVSVGALAAAAAREVDDLTLEKVLGGGEPVGRIRVVF